MLAQRGAARAQPAVSRLTRRDAFIELVKFSFCLETQSRDRLARQFERLSHDTGAVTVRRLSVPRDLSKIDGARDAILADLIGDG